MSLPIASRQIYLKKKKVLKNCCGLLYRVKRETSILVTCYCIGVYYLVNKVCPMRYCFTEMNLSFFKYFPTSA